MKLAQTLFFLVAAALALAVGSVNAADTKAKSETKAEHKAAAGATSDKIGTDKNDPGFNKLDKNDDGYLSKSEAAKSPTVAKRFQQADRNHDGKLSRAEYLMTMTAKDASTAKKKVENAMDRHNGQSSSAGGTTSKSK
jgi:Ca2+-binding EF-hand superfamily protein